MTRENARRLADVLRRVGVEEARADSLAVALDSADVVAPATSHPDGRLTLTLVGRGVVVAPFSRMRSWTISDGMVWLNYTSRRAGYPVARIEDIDVVYNSDEVARRAQAADVAAERNRVIAAMALEGASREDLALAALEFDATPTSRSEVHGG